VRVGSSGCIRCSPSPRRKADATEAKPRDECEDEDFDYEAFLRDEFGPPNQTPRHLPGSGGSRPLSCLPLFSGQRSPGGDSPHSARRFEPRQEFLGQFFPPRFPANRRRATAVLLIAGFEFHRLLQDTARRQSNRPNEWNPTPMK